LKSNVSDSLKLAEVIYIDATAKCIADVSDLRDLVTIRSRVESEGLSFLTITLPQFCRDFERSLANGGIDPTAFRNFRKVGAIPAFLQGMLGLLFDRETGGVNDELYDDSPTVVESIRQICLAFKKLEVDCTPERTAAAFASFTEIERSLDEFSASREDVERFISVSSILWDGNLVDINPLECRPKHGPGATAEGISGNQKYLWQRWHDRLEPYYPLIDSAYPLGIPIDAVELKKLTIVQPEAEEPVKVISVPKTLKSPRIIAIEPVCMQYAQQGIRDKLYSVIESAEFSAGHVNFRDQSINQRLAMIGSSTGRLATIDLSDASDRVPRDLALQMFRCNPDLQGAIDACRSTRARLPDGTIIDPLRKFASMGSALCFPIEAMYFYTICVVACLEAAELPVSRRNCFKVSRDIYVYGDDLIVPSTYAMIVLDHLRKYNCKVNIAKTFVSGSFRESCGVDAYKGYEVTPTYVRKLHPENMQQADRIISRVATANSFYKKGYWQTARLIFNQIEKLIGPLPYVAENSPGLGRFTFLGMRSIGRWGRKLQQFEVNCWVPKPVYRTDRLEGYGALMKSFLKLEDLKNPLVSRDASHLEHSALHGAVALTRRWLPSLF